MTNVSFIINSTFSVFLSTNDYEERKNTTIDDDAGDKKLQLIFDRIQFSMTVIGLLGNIIVFITLSRNGNMFTSPTILRLLKNQSVADSIVCLLGSIFVMQPSMWTTSNETFSTFVCMVCVFFLFIK